MVSSPLCARAGALAWEFFLFLFLIVLFILDHLDEVVQRLSDRSSNRLFVLLCSRAVAGLEDLDEVGSDSAERRIEFVVVHESGGVVDEKKEACVRRLQGRRPQQEE